MLIDPTRALRSPPSTTTPVALEPSISAQARPWLLAAAQALGQPARAANAFAQTGLLSLEAVNVVMFCKQASPPQWALMGYIKAPEGVSALLWSEALLRSNCVAMAMDTCAFSVDDQGSAVLVKQMPVYQYANVQALVEALAQVRELAISLRVTVHAAATVGGEVEESALPAVNPATTPGLAQLTARIDALAQREINAQWHRALIEQALRTLALPVPTQPLGSVGAFIFGTRHVEIIAAPDQAHLLLSTPVDLPLATLAQRNAALKANLYLMTTADSGLALAPVGASLQSRWDCTGQGGDDLARWLVNFVTLATALETQASLP